MTKKPETGSSLLAFETPKMDVKVARNKSRKSVRQRSGLSSFDFQKTRASHHFTDRMQGYGLKPLRENELKSIFALFAWVANEQGAAEETVQSMTETRFCVKDVSGLQQKDYDEVIKFLVDLRIDEMRH